MKKPNITPGEWRDINDQYSVSKTGLVKSKFRYYQNRHRKGLAKHVRDKIIRPSICKKGYRRVCILYSGHRKTFMVHRLVSIAFVPNPYNLPEINHKDGDKSNNSACNLEWCTSRYNIRHSFRELGRQAMRGEKHYRSGLYLNTQTGVYYNTTQEAADSIPMNRSTLNLWLLGKHKNKSSIIKV